MLGLGNDIGDMMKVASFLQMAARVVCGAHPEVEAQRTVSVHLDHTHPLVDVPQGCCYPSWQLAQQPR